jgi:arabinogalactan oligomer/maltooligosaccharide transport system permease protein
MASLGQRIRDRKIDSTWLVLGGVLAFVLVVAFFVLRLPVPAKGYGGLNRQIIGSSLQQLVPALLAIVIGAIAIEVAVYSLLHYVFHSEYALAYALLAPAAVGLAVFVVYPFIYDIQLAFSNAKLNTLACYSMDPRIKIQCSLPTNAKGQPILYSLQYAKDNFQRVFFVRDPATGKLVWGTLLYTQASTFPNIFGRTILWTAINVFFHVTGGMILAILLNRPMALKGLYRTLIVVPWAIPQVIVALAWRGEFHSVYGFVNVMLGKIAQWGIGGWHLSDLCLGATCFGPQPWLKDQPWAFIAVVIVNVWLGIPFMMVIILGGLQSVPHDFYEAAQMDGANGWQQFWKITLPMIRPILTPAITLGAIWTFNQFNVIYLVTEGGPQEKTDILVTALYNAAIGNSRYAFGAAFSLVIFVILLIFAVGWINISGGLKGVYD